MEVTEVRVKLADEYDDERMLAYCSVTLDDVFVVRDLRVVEGNRGRPILCMPGRKITDKCPTCSTRNPVLARYCNECGKRLADNRAATGPDGRVKLFADVAHPVNSQFRRKLEDIVLGEVAREQTHYEERMP